MNTIIEIVVTVLMFSFACHESYAVIRRQLRAIASFLHTNKLSVRVWLKVAFMVLLLVSAAGPVMYYGYKVLDTFRVV